jgi:hypothetical protein
LFSASSLERAGVAVSAVHSCSRTAYSETMHAATDLPRRHWLAEGRVELIDGEIIDMAPPGSPHAATVTYLPRFFPSA